MNHLTATHYFCWRMGAKRTSGTFIGTVLKNIVKHFWTMNVKLKENEIISFSHNSLNTLLQFQLFFILQSKWNRLFSWQPKDSTGFYKNDCEDSTDIYDQFQVCLQILNFRWLLNFERRTTVFNFVSKVESFNEIGKFEEFISAFDK